MSVRWRLATSTRSVKSQLQQLRGHLASHMRFTIDIQSGGECPVGPPYKVLVPNTDWWKTSGCSQLSEIGSMADIRLHVAYHRSGSVPEVRRSGALAAVASRLLERQQFGRVIPRRSASGGAQTSEPARELSTIGDQARLMISASPAARRFTPSVIDSPSRRGKVDNSTVPDGNGALAPAAPMFSAMKNR
jgi:hypothetical protein